VAKKCTISEKATFGILAAHMLFEQHNTELAKVKYHNRVPILNIWQISFWSIQLTLA